MKSIFITILTIALFAGNSALAQSFEVIGTNTNQVGVIGEAIRTSLHVKNNSDKPLYYRIVAVSDQLGSSQESLICFDNDCYKSNIVEGSKSSSMLIRKLNPGETDNAVTIVLETGLVQSVSSVVFNIENVDDPSDFIVLEMQYEVTEKPEEGLLYSSKNVDLSDVYPNPVTETAIFDYNIKDDSKEAKIIIHNVLGSVAGEYDLNPFEQQLKISVEKFNPGVYFYSLYIDNEGVATKKLVVRK